MLDRPPRPVEATIPQSGLILFNQNPVILNTESDPKPNGSGSYLATESDFKIKGDNSLRVDFIVFIKNDYLKLIVNYPIKGRGKINLCNTPGIPDGFGNIELFDEDGNVTGEEKIIVWKRIGKNGKIFYKIEKDRNEYQFI